MGAKEQVLSNLKEQWKVAVKQQYQTEPEKVKSANIEKNANEIVSSPLIKPVIKKIGITIEDIRKVLTEIRDEVITEEK